MLPWYFLLAGKFVLSSALDAEIITNIQPKFERVPPSNRL